MVKAEEMKLRPLILQFQNDFQRILSLSSFFLAPFLLSLPSFSLFTFICLFPLNLSLLSQLSTPIFPPPLAMVVEAPPHLPSVSVPLGPVLPRLSTCPDLDQQREWEAAQVEMYVSWERGVGQL